MITDKLLVTLLVSNMPSSGQNVVCDVASGITGSWRDHRHPAVFSVMEVDGGDFTVAGPWPGKPHGKVYTNGSIYLNFTTSYASGVLFPAVSSSGGPCVFIRLVGFA